MPFSFKFAGVKKALPKRRKKKKTNSTKYWLPAISIIIFLAVCIYFLNQEVKIEESKFIRYPAFGIELPSNFQIHGIDVSKYQGFINWPSVKAMEVDGIKIGFCFIKATEGLGNVDNKFRRNWKNAELVKMSKGAYHFFLPTKSGKLQAKHFISTVTLSPGDLPPVLDIEHLYGVNPDKMVKEVKIFLDELEEHYKVKPIIYTYANFYTRYMQGRFDDYPLWIAHYFEPNKPRINRPFNFWQHSEKGRVNGIKHRVDFNVFNGDSGDFKKLLIK